MRFTPFIFASAVAAAGYYPAPVSSAPASSSSPAYGGGYGGYKPSSSVASSSSAHYGGYYPKSSSSSVVSSKKGGPKKWKTTTTYETECYTVTSSSSTKVWTSVKAIPTVYEDDEDDYSYTKKASTTPAAPVKPTYSSVPYCAAVTETCTVTVTAGSDYTPKPKPTASTPAGPVAPVYSGSYAKPSASGTGYTKPKAPEFTGAASAQKAGALLAGAGAFAAMLL